MFALGRVGVASFSNFFFVIFSQIANLWLDFRIVSSCFDYAVLILPNFECFKKGGKTECVFCCEIVKALNYAFLKLSRRDFLEEQITRRIQLLLGWYGEIIEWFLIWIRLPSSYIFIYLRRVGLFV